MNWLRARIEVPAPAVASVEALFEVLGANAVSLEDARDQSLLEPAPGETPIWADVRVSGLFPSDPDPTELVARAAATWREQMPWALPEIAFAPLADEDWTRSWRQHARPLSFPGRLHLVPVDDAGPVVALPEDGGVHLLLSPGLAFGTGGHPTTRGCLRALAEGDVRGSDVIDFGCGSGILALAALLLGARRAIGIDHDPQALIASKGNAARNGVGDRFEVRDALNETDVGDVLLANVLARPLIDLAPALQAAVRPGGLVVLSGLLPEQVDDVAHAWNLCDLEPEIDDGWVVLAGRRTS